ncbi:hypothetical protein QFZ98_004460 [Paraburkholderia youngii]
MSVLAGLSLLLRQNPLKVSPHAACRQIYAHQKTRNQLSDNT